MPNLSVIRAFIRESVSARDVINERESHGRIPYSPLAPAPFLLQYLIQSANAPDLCDKIYRSNTDDLLFYFIIGAQSTLGYSLLQILGDAILADSIIKKIAHLEFVTTRTGATPREKNQQAIKIWSEIFFEILLFKLMSVNVGKAPQAGDVVVAYAESWKIFDKVKNSLASAISSMPNWIWFGGNIWAYMNIEDASTAIAEEFTNSDLIKASEYYKKVITAPEYARQQIIAMISSQEKGSGFFSNIVEYIKGALKSPSSPSGIEEKKILGSITLETSWKNPDCLKDELKRRATGDQEKDDVSLSQSKALTADERELDTLRQYFKLNYPYLERYITDLASARKFSALGMSKLSSMNKSAQLLGTRYDPSGNPIKTGPEIRNSSTR